MGKSALGFCLAREMESDDDEDWTGVLWTGWPSIDAPLVCDLLFAACDRHILIDNNTLHTIVMSAFCPSTTTSTAVQPRPGISVSDRDCCGANPNKLAIRIIITRRWRQTWQRRRSICPVQSRSSTPISWTAGRLACWLAAVVFTIEHYLPITGCDILLDETFKSININPFAEVKNCLVSCTRDGTYWFAAPNRYEYLQQVPR